jgi:predicted Ser/Thr protein kinase
MDYKSLNNCSFSELKKMAKEMDLGYRRSKSEYVDDISEAFKEYEDYKKKKIDKYTRIRQLGNKGKEGITYLVTDEKNREFAMKTFRKTKSSNTLKLEYSLQKRAASKGISPRVVEYDSISKYIVMEKMDMHLLDLMKKQKGHLGRTHQLQIIDIFKKLDDVGVFHGDSNILNYMLKDKKIYIIYFGFAKEINSKLIKKLGTESPNMRIMTIGFILKLKELNCEPSSWKYLKRYITDEELIKFQID